MSIGLAPPKRGVGVVIARFQVSRLTEGQQAILYKANEHDRLIVLLGSSSTRGTQRNPLSFQHRFDMVREHSPHAIIVPLPDMPTDLQWSSNVDATLERMAPGAEFVLYHGRDSFRPHYIGHWTCEEVESSACPTGTDCRKAFVHSPTLWGGDFAEAFREGAIYAAQAAFPKTFPTVDIAMIRRCEAPARIEVLVGRKSGDPDGLWRFPGGFVEPSDDSYERAANREFGEEVTNCQISALSYLGSCQIADWRYRGPEAVMTSFFVGELLWGRPEAGDDLKSVEWLRCDEHLAAKMVPLHAPLVIMLLEWLERT